ncbi:hypothetical protein QBC38DRAFT_471216 [Podospora fimiseda]|uniref:Calcineurin-like phosphoesterase domain-containing protein n=1 Tax=Podospora fimiseda TaxID=252190 RepID=A0AAN7BUP0_9PEZI|nr:hypothetical protein QBC38DRAFT_471216 [Podospora fimiseda]
MAAHQFLTWTKTSQVQIISDLHLEVGERYLSFTIRPSAPLLLLAGDIGCINDYHNYLAFFTSLTPYFYKIFLVLGNNEFNGLDHTETLEMASNLVKEPAIADKIVLLHRKRWDDPGSDLTILGCTLWSYIPSTSYSIMAKVNEFKKIRNWTPASRNAIHQEEAAWLRDEIKRLKAETIKPSWKGNRQDGC